jgi:hypothetical protein
VTTQTVTGGTHQPSKEDTMFAPGKALTTVTIETPDGPIAMIAETVVA